LSLKNKTTTEGRTMLRMGMLGFLKLFKRQNYKLKVVSCFIFFWKKDNYSTQCYDPLKNRTVLN